MFEGTRSSVSSSFAQSHPTPQQHDMHKICAYACHASMRDALSLQPLAFLFYSLSFGLFVSK